MSVNSEKVCIVTGANAGIGKAAAIKLAASGTRVVIACRNAERARREIVDAVDHPNVFVLPLDTSSMRSVREFVALFEAKFERLDVLINNAGNFDLAIKKPVMTSEGFENVFATNYLGPWLLTNLLLPRLKRFRGRVLNVSSKGLIAYPWLSIELDNLDGARKYSTPRAYYNSKVALLSFTHLLAERLDGSVLVNAIRVPAVQLDPGRLPKLPSWQLAAYKLKRKLSITPEKMAQTYQWLALSDDARSLNGALVDEKQRVVKMPKRALDEDVGQALWDASAQLTNFID